MIRSAALLLAIALPIMAANPDTQVSPGIGALPAGYSAAGGIIIDMLGINGQRLTAQIAPSRLPQASPKDQFWTFWTQTGFDATMLQTRLGGGLQRVNIRITLQDGDSATPNPVYQAAFGDCFGKTSCNGYVLTYGIPYFVNAQKAPGWDFDAGTDLYIAIQVNGGYINLGCMGQTSTVRLDSANNTIERFTGFPGTYALSHMSFWAGVGTLPAQYPTEFPVTGWFTVPSAQLSTLYNQLLTTGSMNIGIYDVDPGDQYYDFTQGVAGDLQTIPLIPPRIDVDQKNNTNIYGTTRLSGWALDDDSPISSVTLQIDGGAATPTTYGSARADGCATYPNRPGCPNVGFYMDVNTANLTPGTHTFRFSVTDAEGQNSTLDRTLIVVSAPVITTTTLPGGVPQQAYTTNVSATGGVPPYSFTLASGTLPSGLTLGSNGNISGVPSSAGTFSFTARVQDALGQTADRNLSIVVTTSLAITTVALPGSIMGVPYTASLAASGGSTPYTWALSTGQLPAGLSLAPNGYISGTPTSASSATFAVSVTDTSSPTPQTKAKSFTIDVVPPLRVQTGTLPNGTVGVNYARSLNSTGGTAPLTWTLQSGALPTGLTLDAAGTITGIPTTSGATSFVVKVTDSTTPTAQTVTQALTLTIEDPLAIATTSLPDALAGTPYSQAVSAVRGKQPYTWSVVSGSLAPGLAINANNGTISGTPTTTGLSSFVLQVSDTNSPAQVATSTLTINVKPGLTITTPSVANTIANSSYSQVLTASGGTGPYTWALSGGQLPSGLTLSPDGTISGLPTSSGTATFTITATDSTTPVPQQREKTYTIMVAAQLAIQTTSLPNGTVGVAYSSALAGIGGTAPYSWSLESGSLPAGLTLSAAGIVTGTPTSAGLTTFVVRITDTTAPSAQTATQTLSIYINEQITIDTATLPDGVASQPYALGLNVHNGTQPYVWTLAGGALPPGIQLLAPGALLGTPSAAGTYTFSLRVTDSSLPASQAAVREYTLRISPAFTISTVGLPEGSTGLPYNASLNAVDGVQPYTFTLIYGTLPPGLILNPDGTIGGTPTAAGVYNLLFRANDASSPTAQVSERALLISIDSKLTITTASLADATRGVPYNLSLIAINGTQPYQWSLAQGKLPDGLTLLQSGALLGTPTTEGSYTFTIQATDSTQPRNATTTQAFTIKVAQPIVITTDSLPPGIIGNQYIAVLSTTGGIQPYTYSLESGSLPAGMSLSEIGVISGIPTVGGRYTFTIHVRDASVISATASAVFTISVSEPLSAPPVELPKGITTVLYSHQLTAYGGTPPYSWSVSSGTLPDGLQLLTPGVLLGTPTQTGSSTLTFTVTDSSPEAQSATLTAALEVTSPLVIDVQSLPAALPTVAYSHSLKATGGTQPYTWTLTGGQLPSGLTLAATGAISGTTTQNGAYPINVSVSDTSQPPQTSTREFILLVDPAFAITTTSPMAPAVVGLNYSQSLSFEAGKQPFTCAIAGGSFPDGITLGREGQLTGTPAAMGDSQFIVRCEDAAGQVSSRPLQLTTQQALSIVAANIPPLVANTAYFRRFERAGGNAPFRWSVSTGELPPGLTLTEDGLLVGMPRLPGTYRATLSLSDSTSPRPQTASHSITLTVSESLAAAPIQLAAQLGTTVTQKMTASGGTPPYTWSVASGMLPNGVKLSAEGDLTGTPTASGSFSVVVNVTDSTGQIAATLLVLNIIDTITIPPIPLPTAVVGNAYAAVLQAVGGAPPHIWQLVEGQLPPGLQLSAIGTITGAPATQGAYSFTLRVSAGAQQATQNYTIRVEQPASTITIPASSAALPVGTVGTLYQASLSANGAQPPVSWRLTNGSLPPGITLNAQGSLGGTPVTAGTYAFSLTIQDSARRIATASYVLTVNSAIVIDTATLPTATVSSLYAAALAAHGGTPPYRWTVTALPAGLTLATTGVFSGTPMTAGQHTLNITVTDSSSPTPLSSATALNLTIAAPLTIANSTLETGTVGTPLSTTLTAVNGVPPYKWNLTGVLPPGLALTPAGTISGTPTQPGTWFATILVSDSQMRTASRQYAMTIDPALTITSAQPSAFSVGQSLSLTFGAAGGNAPYSWRVAGGSLPRGLALTSTGVLTGTPTAAGTATVIIEVADTSQKKASRTFTLTVSPAAPPALRLQPDGTTLEPLSQVPVSITLSAPFGVDLTGQLTVAGNDDQDLGLLQGANAAVRSVRFVIHAGSTSAQFVGGPLILQSGTVSGALTLTATLDSVTGSSPAISSARILPLTPQITGARFDRTPNGFTVIVDGYSTTREITAATFRFYGPNVSSPPFTMSVGDIFTAWYGNPASRGSGVFSYRQTFTTTGQTALLTEIEISLANVIGTSTVASISADK